MIVRGERGSVLPLGVAGLVALGMVATTGCAPSIFGGNGKDNIAPAVDMLQSAGYHVASTGTSRDGSTYRETLTGSGDVGARITRLLEQDHWVIVSKRGAWPTETWRAIPAAGWDPSYGERNGRKLRPYFRPADGAETSLDPDKQEGTIGEDDRFDIGAAPTGGGVSITLSYDAPGMP